MASKLSVSLSCQTCLRHLHRKNSPSILQRRCLSSKSPPFHQAVPPRVRPSQTQNLKGRARAFSIGGSRASVAVPNEPSQVPTPPGLERTPAPTQHSKPLLLPDNLFHPFSNSPNAHMRRRAAFIRQHALCPHPDHRLTHVPTSSSTQTTTPASQPPAHVSFECPDCGIPVYCSENHWADDYESHLEICDTLREINEDDHDLRSERFFPEFEYPGTQMEEALINMTNWDTFLYTREFRAIDDERSMRQVTKLLTYPVTLGSVLHELSPYSIRKGGRLTVEGLRSLSGMCF